MKEEKGRWAKSTLYILDPDDRGCGKLVRISFSGLRAGRTAGSLECPDRTGGRMTSRRSRAREVALQLLFQFDQYAKPLARAAAERFAADRLAGDPGGVAFCLQLFDGVQAHRAA